MIVRSPCESQTSDPAFHDSSIAPWPSFCSFSHQHRGFCLEIRFIWVQGIGLCFLWIGSVFSPLTHLVSPLAGRFCSHLASQSPGVQRTPAHPDPLLVHGRPGALCHPVPGLLQEHPRHHPRPERAGAGGTSSELADRLSVPSSGREFDPTLL